MRIVRYLSAFLLAGGFFARAGDQTLTLPELMQGAEKWAQDNLDSNVLNSLPNVDDPAAQQFFREVQQRFQGDYVVDLAGLRQTARAVLPLLESREETQPYAAWLAAQMDYFDVADEIRITIPAPKVETNQPPPPAANPPPQTEREIWVEKNLRSSLVHRRKGICAAIEADFCRSEDSTGTGLGGGGGVVF